MLGTVQLGLDYGISGGTKPSAAKAFKILDTAAENGVLAFDTASAYGDAEIILGDWLKSRKPKRKSLHIVSKLPAIDFVNISSSNYYNAVKAAICTSIERLGCDYLDGYLFHSPDFMHNAEILGAMYRLKKDSYTKNIGVSVYEPNDALFAVELKEISSVQLPYNLLDREMSDAKVFERAALNNITIYARSVFLQGLLLMNPSQLPIQLQEACKYLQKINDYCTVHNITKEQLALSFVKSQNNIDFIIIGVDSKEQLNKNIQMFNEVHLPVFDDLLLEMQCLNKNITKPFLWQKQ